MKIIKPTIYLTVLFIALITARQVNANTEFVSIVDPEDAGRFLLG